MKQFRMIMILAMLMVWGNSAIAETKLRDYSRSDRVALVIGNEKYEHSPLKSPVNDARDMADTLRELGFQVDLRINQNKEEMGKAIRDFGNKLYGDNVVGLFYFSGHGTRVGDQNYLLPIGANIECADEVETRAVSAKEVLNKMNSAKNPLNFVILDACRNNPYRQTCKKGEEKPGLASMKPPKGTLIFFAAAEGATALDGGVSQRNSPFTASFKEHIGTPGKHVMMLLPSVVNDVAKQTGQAQEPWMQGTIDGDFYFRLADSGSTTIVKPKPPEPEKPKESTLNVSLTTNISGAEVWLNGKKYGKTPKKFTLSESGTYQVKVTASGYKPYQIDKEVELGKEYDVSVHLEKERDESETVQVVTPPPPPLGDKTFTNSLGMKFVKIPAGTFMMGSPSDEPGRFDSENQHRVTLTKGFYMQTTEVTQGQWKAVMGNNPSYFGNCGDNCPVEQVSWDDVQGFIKALNKREKTDRYRLPTEAEWEYAARAGSTTAIYTGDMKILGDNNAPALDPIAWYGGNSCVDYEGGYDCSGWSNKQYSCSKCGVHPVGKKQPNAWGLYDMHGNVWEWVQDIYSEKGVYIGEQTDPIYTGSGSLRVIRGGSWNDSGRSCRSAYRSFDSPDNRLNYGVGFRLSGNE